MCDQFDGSPYQSLSSSANVMSSSAPSNSATPYSGNESVMVVVVVVVVQFILHVFLGQMHDFYSKIAWMCVWRVRVITYLASQQAFVHSL